MIVVAAPARAVTISFVFGIPPSSYEIFTPLTLARLRPPVRANNSLLGVEFDLSLAWMISTTHGGAGIWCPFASGHPVLNCLTQG
jgi:hypothetical protein